MGNAFNDAVMLTEMWAARDAERSARNAWATVEEWQAYAKQLEAEVNRLSGLVISMKGEIAANLAEKVALRQFLAHATNGNSPIIADMNPNNPKHVQEHAKYLRDILHKDAEKALDVSNNWDVVRQVGVDFATKIRKSG